MSDYVRLRWCLWCSPTAHPPAFVCTARGLKADVRRVKRRVEVVLVELEYTHLVEGVVVLENKLILLERIHFTLVVVEEEGQE